MASSAENHHHHHHHQMRPNPKHLLEFFSRSLTSFQSSQDVFRVLCTLPHRSPDPAPRWPSDAAAPAAGRRSAVVVLDSSFNPPTRAHAAMARSALLETETAAAAGGGGGGRRLMLLLAVNNADKKVDKPASFPVRLGMMEGFGYDLLQGLRQGRTPGEEEQEDDETETETETEIDVAVTKMPYFHDKARVICQSGFYSTGDGEQEQEQGPELVFLAGFDTVIRIFDPKYYDDMKAALGPFFERARLRVTMRPDDKWGGREEQEAYVKRLGEKEGEGDGEGTLEAVGGEARWARRVDLVEGERREEAGEEGGAVSSSRVRGMVKTLRGRDDDGDGDLERRLGGLVDGEVMRWIEREELYRNG